MNELTEYRYERLTWPDVNRVLAQARVATLPTGATEQHGRHLPLDVDAFLAQSVCLEVGLRAPDRVVVLPPVSYRLNLHHSDFVSCCLHITKSLAYHGFRKLLVNRHGSNTPLVDLVARTTVLATDSLCAAVNYFALAREAFEDVRETDVVAHADEFETSLCLHLTPERVRMAEATAEKGRVLFEAAVGRLLELVEEWRDWPIDERRGQHETEPQRSVRW